MKNVNKNCIIIGWNRISKQFININSKKFNQIDVIDVENDYKKDSSLNIINTKNLSSIFFQKNPKIYFIFLKNFV